MSKFFTTNKTKDKSKRKNSIRELKDKLNSMKFGNNNEEIACKILKEEVSKIN
jgi:hypothetical protein